MYLRTGTDYRLKMVLAVLAVVCATGGGCDTVDAPPDDVSDFRDSIVEKQPTPAQQASDVPWLMAGLTQKTVTFMASELVRGEPEAVFAAVTPVTGIQAALSEDKRSVTLSAGDTPPSESAVNEVEFEVAESEGGPSTLVRVEVELFPPLPEAPTGLSPSDSLVALSGSTEFSWSGSAGEGSWIVAVGGETATVTQPSYVRDLSETDGDIVWSVSAHNESVEKLEAARASGDLEGFAGEDPEAAVSAILEEFRVEQTLRLFYPAAEPAVQSPTATNRVVFTSGQEALLFQVDFNGREPRSYDQFRVVLDGAEDAVCTIEEAQLEDGGATCGGFEISTGDLLGWRVIAEVVSEDGDVLDANATPIEAQSFRVVPPAPTPEVRFRADFQTNPGFTIVGHEDAASHEWSVELLNPADLMLIDTHHADSLRKGWSASSLTAWTEGLMESPFVEVPENLVPRQGSEQVADTAWVELSGLLKGGNYKITVTALNGATTADRKTQESEMSWGTTSLLYEDLFTTTPYAGSTLELGSAGRVLIVLEVKDDDGEDPDRSLLRFFTADTAMGTVHLPVFLTEGLQVAAEAGTTESFRFLVIGEGGEVARDWSGAHKHTFTRAEK